MSASCSNLCPDEKGTESTAGRNAAAAQWRSNLCPDEKGTESAAQRFIAKQREPRSNLCPDEKGTESLDKEVRQLNIGVATYAPTKRGLKVAIVSITMF